MSAQTPTFVETPEPPSDTDTPSEMPGTPNSTTTSLSALSTTAIKDGHRGSAHPSSTHPNSHGHLSSRALQNTLEAERADRISRLAGLERVATARQGGTSPNPTGGANNNPNPNQTGFVNQIPGYFDALGNPVYTTKISTVGSASATGSVGGGFSDGMGGSRDSMGVDSMGHRTTTWASSSTRGEGDGDTDMANIDANSYGNFRDGGEADMDRMDERRYGSDGEGENDDGMSEEGNASLVAFGEGAGSTVSGPTYTRGSAGRPGMRSEGSVGSTATGAMEQREKAQRLGPLVAGDEGGSGTGFVDTTARSPLPVGHRTTSSGLGGSGVETAERILRERRLDDSAGGRPQGPAMGTPEEAGLGKFYFEEKK